MAELEELLVDRAELDRKLLAEVLLPYIGIDGHRQEIVPKEGWAALRAEGKILVFLLSRKAMCAMPDVDTDIEGALPQDIQRATGVKGGTLRPKLTRMKAEGLLAQDADRRYFVPTHAVLRAKDVISGGGNDDEQRTSSRSAKRRRRARGRGQ